MQGANGVNMYVENLNGTLRLVNSPWNAQLLTVDQSGNTVANGGVSSTNAPGYGQTTLNQWGLASTGDIYVEPANGHNLNL
ncbi:hypothetical protein, partial [Salmonella enterica]